MMTIIIPTLNEGARIGPLVKFLRTQADAPIWIANSPLTTDHTAEQARAAGARVWDCPVAGRAAQMNFVARKATTDLLYFVHADTFPPLAFVKEIHEAIAQGVDFGYFSYCFDSNHLLLRLNSRATRRDGIFAGGGDQTLFIKRAVFEELGGFDENRYLMEDFDLVRRAKRAGYRHRLICNDAKVSARKYEKNSWLRVNLVNLWVFTAEYLGASQDYLLHIYRRHLH
ncbi:MAG: glycosyltransferase [Bacteroidetes bacterium]|nr:MAG: glycosyltransferase [Bacteroidota bacterium]